MPQHACRIHRSISVGDVMTIEAVKQVSKRDPQHVQRWINQVKRWFAEFTSGQLRRGVHTSTTKLQADIRAFIERHNENPRFYR